MNGRKAKLLRKLALKNVSKENVTSPKLYENKAVYVSRTVNKNFKIISKTGKPKVETCTILVQSHTPDTPRWMYRNMKSTYNAMRQVYSGLKSQNIK